MRSYVPAFEMEAPRDLRSALARLSADPKVWKPFAGGTDLMVLLEAGKLPPGKYLSIWQLPELRGITIELSRVTLGALTTYTQIRRDPVIASEFPLMARAASETGSIATQNRGTLGGNIANGSPAADTPPALLVYDAELELISSRGPRTIAYKDFHTGYKQSLLRPDELIASIHLPRTKGNWKQHYRKVGTRRAQAISKVCFAGAANVQNDQIKDVRVAFGSIAPTPFRAYAMEAMLRGATLSPKLISAARSALAKEIAPIDDIRSTSNYRRIVAQNLLAEFLENIFIGIAMHGDPTPTSPPPALDLIVRGEHVVTSDGVRPAAIHIRGGIIVAISNFDDIPPGVPIHDAGDSIVMPGLVDTHVHINEPGRADWEGFTSATRAAAAGGVTTIVEMPLNSIPSTTNSAALREKVAAAAGKLSVDVGFWGGVVPGNTDKLAPLWEAGAFGFKCFLVPSGTDEFESVTPDDLRAALPVLAKLHAPLLAHAELPGPIDRSAKESAKTSAHSPRKHSSWLVVRPREAENEAIALLIDCVREFKARIHVVHVSSSDALPLLRRAHAESLPITSETCPHYLTFTAEEIPDAATQFKCAPPIRERENNEKLWQALADGTIEVIATDHSPCPPAMKLPDEGDFLRAWGGIASLQLSLPAVWTQARARGYSVGQMTDWLCTNPARLAGIEKRKGTIAVGCDADLVIWNPDATFTVDPDHLHHRHKITPYAGRELHGVVETTFLRGRSVYERGEFLSLPHGQVLLRGKL